MAWQGKESQVDGAATAAAQASILAAMPGVEPVAASGQALNCVADATDYTLTVVAGAMYSVSAHNGRIYLGVADATSAANRIVTIHAGETRFVRIPAGITTLHYATDAGPGVVGTLAGMVQ